MGEQVKIILLLLLPFLVSLRTTGTPVRVEAGVLDLRHLEQGDNFSVRMNGEWEFHYSAFIYGTPGKTESYVSPDCLGRVPGFWNDYIIEGKRLPRLGYGTYRALIILPSGYRDRMAFDIPVFDTSYELSINGITVARNGTPARSSAESIPAYKPLFLSYTPKSDTLELLVRVSNYEHRRGGFWMPLKVGSFNTVRTNFTNQWFISIAAAGMLFASFLFFFITYLLDRRNRKLLAFSLLALTLALRPFLSAPYLITIIEVRNWHMIVRGEYLILFAMITSGAWLSYMIYPTKWFRTFSIISSLIAVAGTLLVISTPISLFSWSVWVIQGVALIMILYVIVMSLRGALKKRLVDLFYLIGFLSVTLGVVADILFANAMEENQETYILSFFMLIFVVIQATLLMRDWVSRSRDREKLSLKVSELNRELESRVEKRTSELFEKSEELNARNAEIARQNKKLTETISLKNKIFSVIAHDLRSPVVNILYSLYLLKEEKQHDKAILLADSSIQSSQQLISLLENMLIWGRGQEEMIRYAPAEHDLAEIILTNISILKDGASRKNITLNFNQVGRTKGWFDKDLTDIVIRNLLTNAIKYTHHGGRVTIHLKERDESPDWVTIKVCDNGIGITPERQQTLFSGDEIESTPGTDHEKGTGIGLRLVYELITLSKGTITVESTPGSGSCFTVTLPTSDQARRGRNIF